ncbi:uncharacterized protein LOC135346168 [Halichondria panicea]|uniref:uncharacterized protein LOC135346168 n=1 Tax=Halichondria panicea TaxID=6063 RepID=UPI00312BA9C6
MEKMEKLEQALTDRSLKVLDRLKVACYLWRNTSATKSILKWTCDQICSIDKKTYSINEELMTSLFKFLSVILKTVINTGKWCPDDSILTVHVFESISAAIRLVDSEQCTKSVVDSLQCIMTGSPLPSVLFKFELSVSLLRNILLALTAKSGPQMLTYFPSLMSFLRFFVYLQGSQGNQKKVFTVMCDELLDPLLRARSVLVAEESSCYNGEVVAHLDNILKQIFNKETLSEFPSAVSSIDWLTTAGKQTATSFVRVLFTSLHSITCLDPGCVYRKSISKKHATDESCMVEFASRTGCEGMPYLMETFLLQNSCYKVLSKSVEFKFFLRLFELLLHSRPLSPSHLGDQESSQSEMNQSLAGQYLRGLTEGNTAADTPSLSTAADTPSPALQSLAKCLELLLNYEVYNAGEDGSSGGEQTTFLEKLARDLLVPTTHRNLSDVLSCVTILFRLNHKLVEPWLPLIWLYLFTDSQKGDGFSGVCIETYRKLRQLPVLMTIYVESLDLLTGALSLQPTTLQPCPSLSPVSERLLVKHISSLPPGQCVEIIELFHRYFTQRVTFGEGGVGVSVGEPPVVTLVPSLEKAADIIGVVLSNAPLSVWTSHLKGKALEALLKLHSEVSLLFLQANYTKKCRRRLSSVALYLTCATSQLLSQVYPLYPDLNSGWLPGLVWHDELSSLVPEAWCPWLPSSREKLGPIRLFLLKQLAIVHLKAKLRGGQKTDPSICQAVSCVFQPLSKEIGPSSRWTGQTYDLCHDNSDVAYWQLLLSSLPLLYPYTSNHHLTTMAGGIVTALCHHRVDRPPTSSLTVGGVLREFLVSNVFLEMANLHEALLTCTLTHEQLLLPKCFPKPLRKIFSASCSGEGVFLDDLFTGSLSTSLNCALESLPSWAGPPSSDKKLNQWLDTLKTTIELLESLPLRCVSPVSLQRILLALCVWHTSLTLAVSTTADLPEDSATLPLLVKTSYLLGWVLQCLSLCPLLRYTPKSSKSKREILASAAVKFSSLLDLICEWLYKGTAALARNSCLKIDEIPELNSSLLITMEMAIDVRIKVGGHPDKELDLLAEAKRSPLSERWLHCIVVVACKHCQLTDPSSKRPRPNLEQICEVVVSLIEGGTPDRLLPDHPLLISSLAAVLRCQPGLMSSRVSAIMASLERVAECPVDLVTVLESRSPDPQKQLNVFNALLDCIYLTALSVPPEEAAADCVEPTVPNIRKAWTRLHSSLTLLFRLSLARSPRLNPLDYLTLARRDQVTHGSSKSDQVLRMVYEKVTMVTREVLCMVDREDLSQILEELSEMDCSDPVSVCVFCASWKLILDSKLKQSSREGLRKHFSKVVVLCRSAAHAFSASAPLATGLVQLVTVLVSLPTQVGLDSQSVMAALQMCSLLDVNSLNIQRVELLGAIAEMVMSVCRQHSNTITRSPAPVITALIKLIHKVVASGQDLEEQQVATQDTLTKELVQCASFVSRSMELISQQVVFCKFVMYILHEYIVTAHTRPLHTQVRDSMLPGVFSLMKLASQGDIAFLKSPMDSVTRESCQTLLDQYKQYYKFGGKI